MQRSVRLRVILGSIALIATWPLVRNTDLYLQLFGLGGNNTVYDLQTARTEVYVHWFMHMCDSGECLTHRDWACGYENGDFDSVHKCFETRVETDPVWSRLDRLRKECGHSLMKHTGIHGDENECKKLGGPRLPSQAPW